MTAKNNKQTNKQGKECASPRDSATDRRHWRRWRWQRSVERVHPRDQALQRFVLFFCFHQAHGKTRNSSLEQHHTDIRTTTRVTEIPSRAPPRRRSTDSESRARCTEESLPTDNSSAREHCQRSRGNRISSNKIMDQSASLKGPSARKDPCKGGKDRAAQKRGQHGAKTNQNAPATRAGAGVVTEARADAQDAQSETQQERDHIAGAHGGNGGHAGEHENQKGQDHMCEELHGWRSAQGHQKIAQASRKHVHKIHLAGDGTGQAGQARKHGKSDRKSAIVPGETREVAIRAGRPCRPDRDCVSLSLCLRARPGPLADALLWGCSSRRGRKGEGEGEVSLRADPWHHCVW
jgi:hypothetical protein